jgi:glycerate-2-kinase
LRGEISETPKPGNIAFRKVRNLIIADNLTACSAAKDLLKASKVSAAIPTSSAEMEAQTLGKLLASVAVESRKYAKLMHQSRAVIMGGETTVEVRGSGIGGRNQEVALSAAEDIAQLDGVVIAALGTDGIDGNSTAAGALVDGRTAQRARRSHLSPRDFLANNDSYRFFKSLGDNIFTGRTGTNVGDLYVMLSLNKPDAAP